MVGGSGYTAVSKVAKDSQDNFQLQDYVVEFSSSTRASSKKHLKRAHPLTPQLNRTRFFYFIHVLKTWNSLPQIDSKSSCLPIK